MCCAVWTVPCTAGLVLWTRDVPQRQWVSTAMAVLVERERPLHPFPLQLLLGAVVAAVN